MPLAVDVLTEQLRTFLDEEFEGFTGFPADELDAAAKWANAVDVYTGSGLSLIPPSLTGNLAKAAMQGALAGMAIPGAGPAVFDVAFVAYASGLVPGMLPAMVGVPPAPGLLSVALLANAALTLPPNPPKPVAVQVAATAAVIDAWFRTGAASASGNPPLTPWA